MSGWRGEQSAAEVSEVAARKTGDLLRLTLVLPALIGRGTAREIQLLDRLGLLRGLAYQAADDLKDVLCQEDGSGKTGGRDVDAGPPEPDPGRGFSSHAAALQAASPDRRPPCRPRCRDRRSAGECSRRCGSRCRPARTCIRRRVSRPFDASELSDIIT